MSRIWAALFVLLASVASAQPITCKTGQTAVWVNGQPGCQAVGSQTTLTAPYPGYWHVNSVAIPHYAPCPATGLLKPYTHFTDPDTGNEGYFRYDFSSYAWPITQCPGIGHTPPCQFASAGGPCHCNTWVDTDGYEKPIWAEQQPPNYFPAPVGTTALCSEWFVVGNTATCPGTENYVSAIQNNPVYSSAYQVKLPSINADPGCSGAVVTLTRTATSVPTKTPTPFGPTPTPVPNQFGRYITWATDKGIMSGCGNGMFCPGTPVNGLLTRAQFCAVQFNTYKLDHPDEPLPACRPIYTDVACP